MSEMFQKPPRRMKQPTKDTLRKWLTDKDEELERLRTLLRTYTSTPWWKRIWRFIT